MLHGEETGCRKAGLVQQMSAEGKVRAAIGGPPAGSTAQGSQLPSGLTRSAGCGPGSGYPLKLASKLQAGDGKPAVS